MSVLVVYQDPTGVPKAWGLAPTAPEATAEAKRQLDLWRGKHDPEAAVPFTSYAELVRR